MEAEFLDWLHEQLGDTHDVLLGPGDDAAVLRMLATSAIVTTTDLLTEGVDFLLADVAPARIGRKALAVNLSDLAAMAATPVAALVALALLRMRAAELARALFTGMLPLARQYGVAIAGGDTNTWDGGLVISITAIGRVTGHGPLRRDRARPTDHILVTGQLGGSLLGKQFDFAPRVTEALALHGQYDLHAGMDISDGLALDLSRLAAASRCGAAVELDRVPIAAAARQLAELDPSAGTSLEHALGDCEDFELLLTAEPEVADRIVLDQPLPVPVTRIGSMVAEPGLWQRDTDGSLRPLAPRGFQHGD